MTGGLIILILSVYLYLLSWNFMILFSRGAKEPLELLHGGHHHPQVGDVLLGQGEVAINWDMPL